MADPVRIGIVLSGTAPAMTLMSGALLAFDQLNVPIDVISTTGVGALVGMIYLAPKTGTRQEALRALPNLFVSDWLYRFVPINFKVFYKYGSFAEKFYELRKALPQFPLEPDDPNPLKRFLNDWVQLWATALTPPSTETVRKGFMSHVPLVEDLVNFDALHASSNPAFFLNAFSLETRRLQIYQRAEITPELYNGAQSMFMMFPPVRVGSHLRPPPQPAAPATAPSDLLTTGATHDPTGLEAIWTMQSRNELWGVLALDPLTECFWREPTGAYDAFQLMLMNPVLAFQQLLYALYAKSEQLVNQSTSAMPIKLPRLYVIPPDIKPADRPRMLKWTHENALALQEAGRQAALPLANAIGAHRSDPSALESALAEFRHATRFLKESSRSSQLLNTFSPAFTNFDSFIRGINTPPEHGFGCAIREGGSCDCGADARRQDGGAGRGSQ